MKLNPRLPCVSILLIMIVMIMVSMNINWKKGYNNGVLEADAKGYYAYLPAIFIYKDLNFGFFDTIEKVKYYNQNLFYEYRYTYEGNVLNRYFCGSAIAQLPFFMAAHGICGITSCEQDGYSRPYISMICLAALFYLLIGLLFINKIMSRFGIGPMERSIVLFTMVFGTNLFYYSIVEPGLSHIYSFAFMGMFIYYMKRYLDNHEPKLIIFISLILGMIVLLRPVNLVIVLIIPFLSGSVINLREGLQKVLKQRMVLFTGIVIFLTVVFIQPLIYKISTGSFFVYTYGEQGFDFLHPQMLKILFSYKKGLFLYTPVLLISLVGGYYLWRHERFRFYSLFLFMFILTYMMSSWWNWWYGGSFSSRVYVEYLPLFALLLGIALNSIRGRLFKKLYVTLILLLVLVCQIQIYQYRYYYIHWEDMNKDKYWNEFLRIDKLIK